jgi:hypothetical protein
LIFRSFAEAFSAVGFIGSSGDIFREGRGRKGTEGGGKGEEGDGKGRKGEGGKEGRGREEGRNFRPFPFPPLPSP